MGIALTERSGRRLRLTFAGERLVGSARSMLRELDGSLRDIAEADDPRHGIVRLGFLAPLGTWPLPEMITEFRSGHPGVRFELRNDGASSILRALRAGGLDLLLTERDTSDRSLRFEPLFDQELLLALPAAHPLAGRTRIEMRELADEPWIVQPEGHGLRAHLHALGAGAGFVPRLAFESPDLATLHALIEADNGIGLFAARPRALAPGVVRVPLDPPAARTVGLMSRRGGTIPAAASAFAAFPAERLRESRDR